MITENIIQQLRELHLIGMADSLQRQCNTPEHETLCFEERIHLMIQNERVDRANESFKKRLRIATLPIPNASLEELDPALPRQLDPLTLATVCEMGWVKKHLNILITGPCGIGKSYIASALANAACRADYNVRCFKMPQLATQLARAHALQRRSTFLKALAHADVLLLDDLTIANLTDQLKRDLLEILDDRYDRRSTIVTSQLKVGSWHAAFNDPTLADATLDRLVHNAYKLEPDGDSIRKLKGLTGHHKPPKTRQ